MSLKDLSKNEKTRLKLQSEFEKALKDFLPEELLSYVSAILSSEKVYLILAKDRLTKLGDYHLNPTKGHVISVNSNLNIYSFSITLIHELAHLKAFKIYSNQIKPHGEEWKCTFQNLMAYPLKTNAFPNDIKLALLRHMKNPKASSVRDIELRKALSVFDEGEDFVLVDDVPFEKKFRLKNGDRFMKVEKLRTRFKCRNLDNGRMYFVSRTAEAEILEE